MTREESLSITAYIAEKISTSAPRMAFTKEEKRALLPLTICAIYLFLLVMRGSGMMDYRLSAGVNELWLILAFLVVENQSVEEEPADVKEER